MRLFFTDFRYLTQAAEQVPDFEVIRGQRDLLGEVAERLAGRVGFEDAHVSVRKHERLRGLVGGRAELVAAGDLVEELRAVKEPAEVDAIREAARLADEALAGCSSAVSSAAPEHEVAVDLEHTMRVLGAEGAVVPVDRRAGRTGRCRTRSRAPSRSRRGVLVTIDWGAVVDGYCSDCTRTYATGPIGRRGRGRLRAGALGAGEVGRGGARGRARQGGGRARPRGDRGGRPRRPLRPRARPRRRARGARGAEPVAALEGHAGGRERRDGRAGDLRPGPLRRADRGPRGRDRTTAATCSAGCRGAHHAGEK